MSGFRTRMSHSCAAVQFLATWLNCCAVCTEMRCSRCPGKCTGFRTAGWELHDKHHVYCANRQISSQTIRSHTHGRLAPYVKMQLLVTPGGHELIYNVSSTPHARHKYARCPASHASAPQLAEAEVRKGQAQQWHKHADHQNHLDASEGCTWWSASQCSQCLNMSSA